MGLPDIHKYLKDYCLPHGCKLLEQIGLEGGNSCPPFLLKPLERIVKGYRCLEPEVEKACDRFPEYLDESNPPEVPLPF